MRPTFGPLSALQLVNLGRRTHARRQLKAAKFANLACIAACFAQFAVLCMPWCIWVGFEKQPRLLMTCFRSFLPYVFVVHAILCIMVRAYALTPQLEKQPHLLMTCVYRFFLHIFLHSWPCWSCAATSASSRAGRTF